MTLDEQQEAENARQRFTEWRAEPGKDPYKSEPMDIGHPTTTGDCAYCSWAWTVAPQPLYPNGGGVCQHPMSYPLNGSRVGIWPATQTMMRKGPCGAAAVFYERRRFPPLPPEEE